ncbi:MULTISPECIES: hypothetical protein [Paenarthrobacter]|uniref:Uncharacterized protein n=1 Tax=Paenarthrobacter ureafaciens TaxID=37931 RepID=A0AAX3EQ72_PAEUR|nr:MULTISPECIES: hypothetical protein [Paenarthrobacter]NKR10550.1 hypothetical protein [Arthrobacter sp. M5]NKR15213.1 hypothetical protein [Arthrobacter sp. M6]OEH61555.1 hypothetical protein A5N17_13700 [Arthrobacter sp. D2]OEH61614.1 hypothetical protein A5N13_16120 [Arthrobacter sp. D4]MDO5866990.1 hypothetical protein [Paenarthrobacter sp. SD-2]
MLTEDDIEAGKTAKGGYSRAQLAAWGVPWPPPKGWKEALLRNENPAPSTSTAAAAKSRNITWVPVHVTGQNGRKVTLSGTARSRLSDKIIARKSLVVKDLRRQPIGKLESITNDNGALTVVFVLDEGRVNSERKFLLGLKRQGLYVSFALSAAAGRLEDESPQEWPGMLGETF